MNRFLHRLAGTSLVLILFAMGPAHLVGGLGSIALAQSSDPDVAVLAKDVFRGNSGALTTGLTNAFSASNATPQATEQFVLSLLMTLERSPRTQSQLGNVVSSILAAAASNPALQAAIGQGIGVAVAALAKTNPAVAGAIVNTVRSDSSLPASVKTGISQGLQAGGQTFGTSSNNVVSGLLTTVGTAPLPTTNPVNTNINRTPVCTTGSCT